METLFNPLLDALLSVHPTFSKPMCSFMSLELYRKFLLAPKSKQPKIVRSPSVLCVGRRSHFVRRLSPSSPGLARPLALGLVCYVFVFDQRFIPKPKKLVWSDDQTTAATEKAKSRLTRLCTKFEIYLVAFDSMLFFPFFSISITLH